MLHDRLTIENALFYLGHWYSKFSSKGRLVMLSLTNPVQPKIWLHQAYDWQILLCKFHFFVLCQIRISSSRRWLRGILRTTLASCGSNSSWTFSSIQRGLSSSIKAQTWVLFGKIFWGDITCLAYRFGNQLSPLMRTLSWVPICQKAHWRTMLLACKMLCQAYEPFVFTSSSKMEQFGKYLGL